MTFCWQPDALPVVTALPVYFFLSRLTYAFASIKVGDNWASCSTLVMERQDRDMDSTFPYLSADPPPPSGSTVCAAYVCMSSC
jgi:hypothetical protein